MDDGLKQRLVGAIVLIGLSVIFFPMILDGQHDDRLAIETTIPPKPSIPKMVFEQPEIVAEEFNLTEKEPVIDDSDQPEANVDESKPEIDQQGMLMSWSVQVGSFNKRDNAESLQKTLREQSFKAYIREVTSDDVIMFRVYVGPVIEKAKARELKQQLSVQAKLDGFLIQFN